ncbi:radical SAM protein [candidate division KSB1 bacterium]|nr:radical SAM protein [candidate division KSB1 bacterium]
MKKNRLELPKGVPRLNTYYVYLTAGCNLACQHCWISPTYQKNGGTGGHLDYDLFVDAINQGLELGLAAVKLTGGEPLLHPEFCQMVDYLRRKDLSLIIESNGTLITDSVAHFLKKQGVLTHISISVDGASAKSHDPFRGVKGSFDKAIQGIEHMVRAGFRPEIIMSLHPGNADDIEPFVRLAEEIGAGSVKFNLIQPSGRGENMSSKGQFLDVRKLIEIGTWIREDLQPHSKIRLAYSWPMAFYGIKELIDYSNYTCSIFSILGILATGHLAMCGIGVEVPELCYGHLSKDTVSSIWIAHPMLCKLREKIPLQLEGICSRCIFRDHCLGSCIAQNFQLAKRLTAPFWFCQEAESLGLFPQIRLKSKYTNLHIQKEADAHASTI